MRRLLLVTAFTLVLPTLAHAQNNRDLVLRQLDAVTDNSRKSGWRVEESTLGGGTVVGQLSANGTVVLEVYLRGGHQVLIPAGCDRDCSDLDLRLYSGDGNDLLTEDLEEDDVPVISYTPSSSGRYLVLVSLPKCSTDMCWFGFRVFTK